MHLIKKVYFNRLLALSLSAILCVVVIIKSYSWGFYGHRTIARNAVFILPPEMLDFFKGHFDEIAEGSVQPDIRRYVIKEEGPRHYIDLELYGEYEDSILFLNWNEASAIFTDDTLREKGILPWAIVNTYYNLIEAFRIKDGKRIVGNAADLCHYISDAHVPLHTTYNYNGQFSGQEGIHRLWESLVPEMSMGDYSFWVGKAEYQENIHVLVRKLISDTHSKVDSVLQMEADLTVKFPPDRKYSFQKRGKQEQKLHSNEFAAAYEEMLNGMIERQMRASIKMTGDLWYTCWIEAGQPDLNDINLQGNYLMDLQNAVTDHRDTTKVDTRSRLH